MAMATPPIPGAGSGTLSTAFFGGPGGWGGQETVSGSGIYDGELAIFAIGGVGVLVLIMGFASGDGILLVAGALALAFSVALFEDF